MTELEALVAKMAYQKGWLDGYRAAIHSIADNLEDHKQKTELIMSSLDPDEKQA